jgi:hypothetical protein
MAKYTITFTADASGTELIFSHKTGTQDVTLDNVSLRKVETVAIDEYYPINEFLTGETDNGREIPFRADTQIIQLMSNFENYVNLLAVITKLQRGTAVKCFISPDGDPFYELEGTAIKGVSVIKIPSKNKGAITSPPTAKEIQISWRDSSKQLCRLTQGGVIFLPTNLSLPE